MSFLFTWNATFLAQPADLEDAELGAGRIRDLKSAITERMGIDHIWGVGATDGLHNQVTMPQTGVKPVVAANQGAFYVKDNGSGLTVPYFEDDAGTEHPITIDTLLQQLYPVGSIYINAAVATNPATLLGFGTWVAYATGRALVGLDSGNVLMDTVGETFGTADAVVPTHTHTVTDPGHFHSGGLAIISNVGGGGASPTHASTANTGTKTTGLTVDAAGVSGVNQNYQPSIAVYMWRRTV